MEPFERVAFCWLFFATETRNIHSELTTFITQLQRKLSTLQAQLVIFNLEHGIFMRL
jgi:two-component SAPR family response regulator